MWILYDLAIHLYGDAISIASLFNAKARKWIAGRQNVFDQIGSMVSGPRSAVSSQQSAANSEPPTVDRRPSLGSTALRSVSSSRDAR